jgi:alanine racemase
LNYSIDHIASIVNAKKSIESNTPIEHLLLDSRKVYAPATSLFFALKGLRKDGHQFIPELYKKGVRSFIVTDLPEVSGYPEAVFLQVNDTLEALQQLTAYHRQHFSTLPAGRQVPVIGITGSNGKTIVKEWLYQLLQDNFNIVRSPKSYNSQIGVPLSVWQMKEKNTLAIFEAGISQAGEMEKLERIIRPTIGILTNIGEAHSEGFSDNKAKLSEKAKLFRGCEIVVVNETLLNNISFDKEKTKIISWGSSSNCTVQIISVRKEIDRSIIIVSHQKKAVHLAIPFTDDASVENAITCYCTMAALEFDTAVITERMLKLQPVNMRLELKKGINHCAVINDSYSADLSSLEIALNFLEQQSAGIKKTVVLSDFLQVSVSDEELYTHILLTLRKHNVTRLIGIGERISGILQHELLKQPDELVIDLYSSTEDFIKQFRSSFFREETILIKGARVFEFERIVQLLEQKVHQTVLEINLNAIVHNLKAYQKILKPSTKIMAMVKALAYGSGGAEIGGILQYHKADYLGVAYADEGVDLRKAGITLPVMVMNPEENAFEALIEHNLEPEIFSFDILRSFESFLKQEGLQQYPIHIEIETGMNRLGFETNDVVKLADLLGATASFKVQSVFSHLAASEEAAQDNFTLEQFKKFQQAADILEDKLGYSFIRHIANSAAAVRHPELQLDMLRLGIGLYGVDIGNSKKLSLQTVATLKSTIAQIKKIRKGESVSYNRKAMVGKETTVATIRIGYADGYPRRLGNGAGKIFVSGKLAPTIGTVCMDMLMIDVTDVAGVKEGDEVIIFGDPLPVQQVANWAGTIPYEIMTGVSQRVKRVYFEE